MSLDVFPPTLVAYALSRGRRGSFTIVHKGSRSRASYSVRTSPPAAKLGAGVEKSPGPSLFLRLRRNPRRPIAHALAPRAKRLDPLGLKASVSRPPGGR